MKTLFEPIGVFRFRQLTFWPEVGRPTGAALRNKNSFWPEVGRPSGAALTELPSEWVQTAYFRYQDTA